MVASQHEEVFRVFDLEAKHECYCLNRLLSSIDVISQEQVVSFRRETSVLEQPQQIIVLSMHITYQKRYLS